MCSRLTAAFILKCMYLNYVSAMHKKCLQSFFIVPRKISYPMQVLLLWPKVSAWLHFELF